MIEIRDIIALTAINFDLDAHELVSERNTRNVSYARQVAMFVCRQATGASLPTIGKAFSRDHTTVLYAVEKIEAEVRAEPRTRALVEALKRSIALAERIEIIGGVDVLKVARCVAANPARQAIAVSVMETAALAATVLDLWEIAEAAEELVRLNRERTTIMAGALEEGVDADHETRSALEDAIANCMAAIRGTQPEE